MKPLGLLGLDMDTIWRNRSRTRPDVDAQVGWFNTTVNGYGGARVTVPNRRILDGTVVDKTNKRYRVCQAKLAAGT